MKKVIMLVVAMMVSGSVMAQVACMQDEKPHYFVATGTAKTAMPDTLKAVLTSQEQTVWQNTYRTFSVVSPAHNDLAACTDALEMMRAQRAIAPKNGIHALQSVAYEGFCLPVEVCP